MSHVFDRNTFATSSRCDSTYELQCASNDDGSAATGPICSVQQKYQVKMQIANTAFIPTINAITSNQELQWMVQPAVIAPFFSHPYSHLDGSTCGPTGHSRPAVIQSVGNTHWRNKRNEQLTLEEEEKRRVRRERNKMAAAKCRNRRRELTDLLLGESERLEWEQAGLQRLVESLQEQRNRLKLVLASHGPACRLALEEHLPPGLFPAGPSTHPGSSPAVKQEPPEETLFPAGREHPAITPTFPQAGEHRTGTERFKAPVMVESNSSSTFSYPTVEEKDNSSSSSEAWPKGPLSKAHSHNNGVSLQEQSQDLLSSPTALAL